ncbi:MAG: glycosyltransferase family 2 protein, partial [Pirellula sp.]
MDLSCVILSYNSSRCIERCLESLVQAIDELRFDAEIWVVDNGSTDGSPRLISTLGEKHQMIRLISLEKNYGTTSSRNKALSKSTGKQVLVLDSDAYISTEALQGLSDHLLANPRIGLVSPKLIFPDGRPQLSVDQFPTVPRKIERVVRLRQIERRQKQDETIEVDYAISACWMLSRQAVDAVGLFDEAIFYAPEDVDYCLRIWKAGYRIVYRPD